MQNSWRTWCRLCADEHSNVDIFIKTEGSYDIAELIRKFLQISVDPADLAPQTICESCYKFLIAVVEFAGRVIKVETMYASIVNNKVSSVDCTSWRAEFNLLHRDVPLHYPGKKEPVSDMSDSNIELLPMDYKVEHDIDTEDKVEAKFNPPPPVEMVTVEQFTDDEEDSSESNFEHNMDSNDNEADEPKDKEKAGQTLTAVAKTPQKRGRKKREPPFKCSKCEMVYLRYNELRYHRSTTHFNKQVPCRYCDKKFPSKPIAEQHEVAHLDPDKKPAFPCIQCDKCFTKSSNLYTHIRTIHSSERAFICESCGKPFATKGGLKQHTIIHDDEKPFQCPSCPKKFKTLERLKIHEDSHGETIYPCPECGLVLNTKRTLRTHMVVHSDERKFKCTVCGNEFKRSKTLKTHMVIHTGLRPHICPYCDKAFAKVWECRGHVKKAHPQEVYPEMATETERKTPTT